ncbi:hypothetical protein OAE36_00060 [bacterium]|nr:hypothetical protein [bacterium]
MLKRWNRFAHHDKQVDSVTPHQLNQIENSGCSSGRVRRRAPDNAGCRPPAAHWTAPPESGWDPTRNRQVEGVGTGWLPRTEAELPQRPHGGDQTRSHRDRGGTCLQDTPLIHQLMAMESDLLL